MEPMKSMKRALGRTPQAKTRRQLTRSMEKVGEMARDARGKGRREMDKLQAKRNLQRMKKNLPWKNLLGLVGGAVGLAAFMAIGRSMARSEKRKSLARSGQAPGRSHIQISTHPAAQSRYQPSGRQFGTPAGQR